MPPLLMSLIFNKIKTSPMPFFIKPVARGIADKVMSSFVGPQLTLHFDYLDAELGKQPWFGGKSFSAADIQMSFPIEAAAARLGFEKRPNLQRYLNAIQERPAYQRALERGGPYQLMG